MSEFTNFTHGDWTSFCRVWKATSCRLTDKWNCASQKTVTLYKAAEGGGWMHQNPYSENVVLFDPPMICSGNPRFEAWKNSHGGNEVENWWVAKGITDSPNAADPINGYEQSSVMDYDAAKTKCLEARRFETVWLSADFITHKWHLGCDEFHLTDSNMQKYLVQPRMQAEQCGDLLSQ
jgi:hypothetical protein